MTANRPARPYVVTASADGLHQRTRRSAAGALDLARCWAELGYTAITVRGPDGSPLQDRDPRGTPQRPDRSQD